MKRILLPAVYLPSIHYFCALLSGNCIVDVGEHFIKRSERNRARIMTSDGVMELSAQVVRANRPRQPMHTIRLDYSKRWQKQHWGALVAAYKGSPYFDHYASALEPFYTHKWTHLAEYNMEYTLTLLKLLGIPSDRVRTSENYITATEGDIDLRPKAKKDSTFVAEPYYQVFSDRMPFEANLSVLDLLLCEGPSAIDAILMRCRW